MGRPPPRLLSLWGASLVAMAAALWLAAQHPVAPLALALALCLAAGGSAWRPWHIGGLLAGLLPVAGFAPWTGWWLVDEFDLLMLAVLAGAWARWGLDERAARCSVGVPPPAVSSGRLWTASLFLLAGAGLSSLGIGLNDAGVRWSDLVTAWSSGDAWRRAVYADYTSAFNAVRVSKSLLWAVLLYPLLQRGTAMQQRRMAWATIIGLGCGLALVCGLVLWERWRYVGVLNFSESYRTVAHFWEMHVGGGAIDAYLAMTVPVALWCVWLAPGGWRWVGAALLALLSTYAVLTTYSRGVYLAVAVSLIFMGWAAWRYRIKPSGGTRWRRWAVAATAAALVAESVWVLVGHSYMADRMERSEADLMDRMAHWQNALGLLRSPGDVALGLGAGRMPAHYSARVEGGEFPGRVQWQRHDDGEGVVTLYGPATQSDMAYDFGLTQRVDPTSARGYRVRYRFDTDAPVLLLVSLCDRHLLYDIRCQWKHLRSETAIRDSQTWHEAALSGWAFTDEKPAHAARAAMFTVTVLSEGQQARLHEVELFDGEGQQLLHNTRFADGLAHWLPVAQAFFKPWHVDNLYLELLIERGLLGWLCLALLVTCAWRSLAAALRHRDPLAVALAGSLISLATLGLVISVMEMSRIAFLMLLILLTTSQLDPLRQDSRP